MNKAIIHIVACLDHGFVMPTGVMMYSVCVNNPNVDINFHLIVDESVTEDDRNDITETIARFGDKRVAFYHISSRNCLAFPICNNENNLRITQATYYRLFLTDILPETLDKVLYLDGDCICRHSLLPLWETDISNYAVGAVFDVSEGNIEYYNRLKYPFELGYFNAGVLLVNLDYWRKKNVLKLFADFIGYHFERMRLEDQDVLNFVFQDKKLYVPAKYNFQSGFFRKIAGWDYWKYENELIEAKADPVVVHFSTLEKPWFTYTRHPHPFSSTFYKYQNQTKWKGVRLEKRNIKQRIRNSIVNYLRKNGFIHPLKSRYIDILPID